MKCKDCLYPMNNRYHTWIRNKNNNKSIPICKFIESNETLTIGYYFSKTDNELLKAFLDLIETGEYAPEPFDDDVPMTAEEWIFDEYEHSTGFDNLANAKAGYDSSIDNCSGELWNYNVVIAEFLTKELKTYIVSISEEENTWIGDSQYSYNGESIARFLVQNIKNTNQKFYVSITRSELSESRIDQDELILFFKRFQEKLMTAQIKVLVNTI